MYVVLFHAQEMLFHAQEITSGWTIHKNHKHIHLFKLSRINPWTVFP